MSHTTLTKTEKIILEEIAYFKWGHRWCCTKCGYDIFTQGKKDLSRRCKKCRYEESVLKYTAFEGIRFSIGTAWKLLNKIISTAVVNAEEKILPVGRYYPDSDRDENFISIIDYILSCKDKGMDPNELDAKVLKIINSQRPSVRELSRIYGIEENTVTKFLDKINARIGLNEVFEYENSHERLISFINEHYNKEPDFYLSLLSVPLVGKWESGEIRISGKQYALTVERRGSWAVYEVMFMDDDSGTLIKPFTLNERIEYGTDEWKRVFIHKNILP